MGNISEFGYFVEDHRNIQTGSLIDSTRYPLIERKTVSGYHYEILVDHVPNEHESKLVKINHDIEGENMTVDINFNEMDLPADTAMVSRSIYEHGVMYALAISLNGFLGAVPGQYLEDPFPVALVYAMNRREHFDMGIMISPMLRKIIFSPRGESVAEAGRMADFSEGGLAGFGIGSGRENTVEVWTQLTEETVKVVVQSGDEWVARQYPIYCDYSWLKGEVGYTRLKNLTEDMAVVSGGRGYNWRHE